ncbi:MAG: hypothetical protein Q6K70_03795 [Thermostichales cyanobacterium DRC_bins_46]
MATLRHILLGCTGGLLFDEPLYLRVINQVLLEENAPALSQDDDYRPRCYGTTLGERLHYAWQQTGRILSPELGSRLHQRAQIYYAELLRSQARRPLITGVIEALMEIQRLGLSVMVVAAQTRRQLLPLVDTVQPYCQDLYFGDCLGLAGTVASGDLHRQLLADLGLDPQSCLSLEATYAGMAGAKAAGIPVLGLATLFPYPMVQRRSQWVVDSFRQIEWERIQRWYATGQDRPSEPATTPPEQAA